MRNCRLIVCLLAALAGAQVHAHGEDKHSGPAVAPTDRAVAEAREYFTNLALTTQDGRTVRFHDDVLAGRTVLINVIYTACRDACPLITFKLAEVRAALGERFGREVFFVSISSDPVNDTPAALKAFAREHGADASGWTFLTGAKENVDKVLARLGQLSGSRESHSTMLIAGNVPARRWSKLRPDSPKELIAARLALLADPASESVPLPPARR